MRNLPLTPQERQVIEEAFAPYVQAVTIIAKLRGLNPGTAQLAADRQSFVVPDEMPAPALEPAVAAALPAPPTESNGVKSFG